MRIFSAMRYAMVFLNMKFSPTVDEAAMLFMVRAYAVMGWTTSERCPTFHLGVT